MGKELKIKKIKPMFTGIITTFNKYDDDILVGGLIDGTRKRGTLKEYQKVLAVGTSVRDIQVGDMVYINPIRYGVRKHREGSLHDGIIEDNPITDYNFPVVRINDEECLFLQDRDVDFIIQEYEEVEEK